MILTLAFLGARAPGFHGRPFHFDFLLVALHVGYLNAFVGLPWLNVVFWTLAIECQFYLLIAIVFPLIVHRRRAVRLVGMGALLMAGLFSLRGNTVIYYLPLFACGIVGFQWFAGACAAWEAPLLLVPAAALLYMHMGALVMVAGLATSVIIVAIPAWTSRPLAFLGTLSYSLYLLHVPVGGRVINLAGRLPASPVAGFAGVAAALVVTIAAAYLMYRLVERPAQIYAGSLRFGAETPPGLMTRRASPARAPIEMTPADARIIR